LNPPFLKYAKVVAFARTLLAPALAVAIQFSKTNDLALSYCNRRANTSSCWNH